MRRQFIRCAPCAAALLIGGAAASAAAEEPPRGQFDKGTWTFQAYGGYLNDLGPYDVEAGFASAGVGYYLVDGVSLSAEVSGYGVSQPVDNAAAVAPGIVLRHHLFDNGSSTFFVDVAAAAFAANERVPDEGTRFNFATQTGVGITHRLDGESHLLLGARFFHLSNANLEGDDRNPSLNGLSLYVGLLFKL